MPGRWLAAITGASGWPGLRLVTVILYISISPPQLLAAASMDVDSKHPANKYFVVRILVLLEKVGI